MASLALKLHLHVLLSSTCAAMMRSTTGSMAACSSNVRGTSLQAAVSLVVSGMGMKLLPVQQQTGALPDAAQYSAALLRLWPWKQRQLQQQCSEALPPLAPPVWQASQSTAAICLQQLMTSRAAIAGHLTGCGHQLAHPSTVRTLGCYSLAYGAATACACIQSLCDCMANACALFGKSFTVCHPSGLG